MIAPYQVAPPQGNLLGSILDFIGQRTAQQVEQGTRGYLGAQAGLPENVDPFGVQKYQGEGQRQFLAGEDNNRANENQSWMRGDRAQIGQLAGSLQGNPVISADPLLSSLAQSGANPAIMQQLLGMLGNDRSQATALSSEQTLQNLSNQFNTTRDATRHGFNLEEIQAQLGGQFSKTTQAARLEEARRKFVETGDMQELLILGGYDDQVAQARADLVAKQKQAADAADAPKYMPGGSTAAAPNVFVDNMDEAFMAALPAPLNLLGQAGKVAAANSPPPQEILALIFQAIKEGATGNAAGPILPALPKK